MIQFGQTLRVRILKLEGSKAFLGIYVDGEWHRISARMEQVSLKEKDWIYGRLEKGQDGTIYFKRVHDEKK